MGTKSVRVSEDQYCCYRRLENNGIRVIWELTGRCNLRCKHCFVNKKEKNTDIEKSVALKICRELCECEVDKVMITGGEPLLYKYLPDVISYLRRNSSMIIDITTNGILFTDEMIDLFSQVGIDELSVSLDGPSEIYRKIRGEDDLEIVLRNVKKLSSAGVQVDAIMTVNRINQKFVEKTIELAYDNCFTSITISNLLKLYNSEFDYDQLCLSVDELTALKVLIDKQRQIFGSTFPIRSVGFSDVRGTNKICVKCNNPSLYAIDREGMMLKCLNANHDDIMRVNLRDHTVLESMQIIDRGNAVRCFMA